MDNRDGTYAVDVRGVAPFSHEALLLQDVLHHVIGDTFRTLLTPQTSAGQQHQQDQYRSKTEAQTNANSHVREIHSLPPAECAHGTKCAPAMQHMTVQQQCVEQCRQGKCLQPLDQLHKGGLRISPEPAAIPGVAKSRLKTMPECNNIWQDWRGKSVL